MFILEAGINHFGDLKEAKFLLDQFLLSKAKKLTFQAQTEKFYSKYRNKFDFKLNRSFYEYAINLAHKKNKKIGLAVCDIHTALELKDVKFDFYKLLSISIKNTELIKYLKKKNKKVYISTGKAKDKDIRYCVNLLKNKEKIVLLHTPMSYSEKDLNLNRIKYISDKFKLKSGYSHHFKNYSAIPFVMTFNPNCIFIYIKGRIKKGRTFPDNRHAIYMKEFLKLLEKCNLVNMMLGRGNIENKKIKIFKNVQI